VSAVEGRTSELARGLIVAGISGTRFDATIARFGGYVLFPGDAAIEDVRALTDALRARENPPPVIAIDQEGGRVMRLRAGVEPMPPMMALGAADDVDLTQRAAEQIAFDLRRAGCTLDFAPVLDLALERQNVVIGTRSFGSDPQRVARLGVTFGRGLERRGILPCYKHFPGHGATAVDSHEALPRIDADLATLRARDLFPFVEVAPNAPAIMSAHVLVTALDAQRPATFSYRIASQLLRRELGFHGALVSDCLEMQAAAAYGSERGAEALAAGADLLLFSHDLEAANATVDAIVRAVESRRIPMERLEEAHARAMELRRRGASPLPLAAVAPHPMVGREVARRAITLVSGFPHADPVASIAVSFGATERTLEREAPALEELLAPADPADDAIEGILETLAARERRPLLMARRAHLHPSQARAISRIVDRFPDALVVSLREPFDLPLFSGARHVIAAYGDDEVSIGGLADVIFGGAMPTGTLPVTIDVSS
jgi:beta-N-acetylhexosaminidase